MSYNTNGVASFRDNVANKLETVKAAGLSLVGGLAGLGPCETREVLYFVANVFDKIDLNGYEKNDSYLDITRTITNAVSYSKDDIRVDLYTIALDSMFYLNGFNKSRQYLHMLSIYTNIDQNFRNQYGGQMAAKLRGDGKRMREALCRSGVGTAVDPPYREPSDTRKK